MFFFHHKKLTEDDCNPFWQTVNVKQAGHLCHNQICDLVDPFSGLAVNSVLLQGNGLGF